MTVVVSVKINDGLVMASDSASTFTTGQIYGHADKIVNLVKGLPIGVMVSGSGGIGSESISTLLKDIRVRLTSSILSEEAPASAPVYSMEAVAQFVSAFLVERLLAQDSPIHMLVRLCGYSSGRPLPEIWDVVLNGRAAVVPSVCQAEDSFGIRWDGEREPLNRLLLGVPFEFDQAFAEAGLHERTNEVAGNIGKRSPCLHMNAMPIQDAIDLARWLVEVTSGFVRFNIGKHPKTVGGSTEIAVVTKHEGFRWVQRRHFYPAALNA